MKYYIPGNQVVVHKPAESKILENAYTQVMYNSGEMVSRLFANKEKKLRLYPSHLKARIDNKAYYIRRKNDALCPSLDAIPIYTVELPDDADLDLGAPIKNFKLRETDERESDTGFALDWYVAYYDVNVNKINKKYIKRIEFYNSEYPVDHPVLELNKNINISTLGKSIKTLNQEIQNLKIESKFKDIEGFDDLIINRLKHLSECIEEELAKEQSNGNNDVYNYFIDKTTQLCTHLKQCSNYEKLSLVANDYKLQMNHAMNGMIGETKNINKKVISAYHGIVGAIIGFAVGAMLGATCFGLGAIPGAILGAFSGATCLGLLGTGIGFFKAKSSISKNNILNANIETLQRLRDKSENQICSAASVIDSRNRNNCRK